VTVEVLVPPLVADGAEFKIPMDPQGRRPPLRLRVRA
jgi:hypothetical protein